MTHRPTHSQDLTPTKPPDRIQLSHNTVTRMEKVLSHAGQSPQKQSIARQSNDTSSFVKMKTSPMTFNSRQNPQYWLHYFPPVARVCVVKYHHQFLNIFFNRPTT